MRITDNILFNDFLYNINKINEKTYINNKKMASGKRLLDLASDPISLSKVLSLKDINLRFEQYTTNINSATAYLNAEDTALSTADDLLHKAGTLLVDGANSINNDLASRTAIAENLDSIKDELIDAANTIFQGKYLFSGTKTDTKPIQNIQNEATIIDITKDSSIKDIKITADESFKDINQLDTGNYHVSIENGKLKVCEGDCSDPKNIIPIDMNSSDESDVDGNQLANFIDLNNPKVKEKILNNDWIDTGRGLKIKIELSSPNTDINSLNASLTVNYKAGGKDEYVGNEGKRNIEYSDKLTSPINITAKDIFKPTNQTLTSNNELIDKTTNDPMTESSKLTDLDLPAELKEALQKTALSIGYNLKAGDEIHINGTDHDGNLVKGTYTVSAGSDLNSLLDFIKGLDSTEVLDTNKSFKTYNSDPITSATTLNTIDDANIQNAIGSTLVIKGFTHDGSSAVASISLNATTTIGSIAYAISTTFGVKAYTSHGKIEIEDNTSGDSSLKVYAFTKNSKIPIFGSFIETSKGGSGGFKNIEAKVENGQIVLKDRRPSDSRFDVSFSITDSSGNTKPNIFGVFNTTVLGKGVDTFKALRDASYALKNPYSLNQISKPTNWKDISTFTPTLTGRYLGDKNDQWTVKLAKVGSGTANHTAISRDQIENVANSLSDGISKTVGIFQITDEEGKNIAIVGLTVSKNNGKYSYTIKTKTPSDPDKKIDFSKISSIDEINGTVIYSRTAKGFTSASDVADSLINNMTNIVIQTKNPDGSGNFTGEVNGTAGVKLNLTPPKTSDAPAIIEIGDSFSFKLTNTIQQALGKVKSALDQLLANRSIIGARTNRFQLAEERINYIKLSNDKTISELEDANVADVFSEFKRNQIVMQATLEVGSKLTSQNLFDYLR